MTTRDLATNVPEKDLEIDYYYYYLVAYADNANEKVTNLQHRM